MDPLTNARRLEEPASCPTHRASTGRRLRGLKAVAVPLRVSRSDPPLTGTRTKQTRWLTSGQRTRPRGRSSTEADISTAETFNLFPRSIRRNLLIGFLNHLFLCPLSLEKPRAMHNA